MKNIGVPASLGHPRSSVPSASAVPRAPHADAWHYAPRRFPRGHMTREPRARAGPFFCGAFGCASIGRLMRRSEWPLLWLIFSCCPTLVGLCREPLMRCCMVDGGLSSRVCRTHTRHQKDRKGPFADSWIGAQQRGQHQMRL
jgi:hypothetical protein